MDEDEVKAHMERHKLEEANMAEQPDPVYSSNTREGEYVRGTVAEYINHNLNTSWILLKHIINLQTYVCKTENSVGNH